MKLVLCVVVLVAVLKATAVDTQDKENVFPDYWQDDYDNFYDYDGPNDIGIKQDNEKEGDTEKEAINDLQDFLDHVGSSSNEKFDMLGDYQFEDNRSNTDDKENEDDLIAEKLQPDVPDLIPEIPPVEPLIPSKEIKESNDDKEKEMYDDWFNDFLGDKENKDELEQAVEEVKNEILEDENKSDESKKILEELEEANDDIFDEINQSDESQTSSEEEREAAIVEFLKESKAIYASTKSLTELEEERNYNISKVIHDSDEGKKSLEEVAAEANEDIFDEVNESKASKKSLEDVAEAEKYEILEDNNESDVSKKSYEEVAEEAKDNLFEDVGVLSASKETLDEVAKDTNEDILKDYNDLLDKAVNEENLDSDLDQSVDFNKLIQTAGNLDSNDDQNIPKDDTDVNDDYDSPNKVLDDLNTDLDKLFETLDNLKDNDSDLGDSEDLSNDKTIDNIEDYEEKYKKPFGEGYIMSLRDDYDNFFKGELSETSNENEDERKVSDIETSQEKEAIVRTEAKQEEIAAPVGDDNLNVDARDYSNEIDKKMPFDSEENEFDDENGKHYYGNDGLVDDQMPKEEDAEIFLPSSDKNSEDEIARTATPIEIISSVAKEEEDNDGSTIVVEQTTVASEQESTPMVEELNSAEYEIRMDKFIEEHSEDIDAKSEDVSELKHIILNLDEPTIIESPNHPGAYPTGITVDWIIDGPGTGIEMNLTSCQINGNVGDYLLVRPGAVDADGSDGILFSFRLTSERRYRFTNVNRMFVRFKSYSTPMAFMNGFSMSAKMIWPPAEVIDEEIPEPEAVLEPPTETLKLSLAGVTLHEFHEVRSEFKKLIADMAEAYIKDNEIDPGLNTTLEVTQIVRTGICNIRWPNYESCVDVTFGVPLHYAEEVDRPRLNATELNDMWRTYIVQDKFMSRLSDLGITEYDIPNDRSVLTVWLVVASGILIAVGLLGFALWRFSCFEDYTRMKAFNDSDSIQNEKRNLDLYPTPHQTLPPLYSESDYKWADEKYEDSTRVDLGGFANKSYIRDDLFDLDSDEDVIVPHDRKAVISPRDVYEV